MELRQRVDLGREVGDFVERVCAGRGTERIADAVDKARSTVRDWVGHPEHLPLLALPGLLSLADPADPFLSRFAAALGYRLLPLDPTPEQLAAVLEMHGLLRRNSAAKVATVIRGVQADPRQAGLGFEP